MIIENTERLSIALMDETDAQLMWELDQDPEVMRYINGGKISSMEDIEQVMIPRMKTYRDPEKGWGLYKVYITDSNEFIGWILVRPMDFFNDNTQWDNLELGWRFKQSSWGKGYGTEAAKAVMDALHQQKGYKRFAALALEGNEGSMNIMKKLGMRFVERTLHKDPLGDLDVVYYQLDL